METFALKTGSWLQRLVARSPLVRASDRIEAAAVLMVLVAAVLVTPFAGAVGTAVYDGRVHAFAAERLTRHEVEANATRDSSVTRLPYQSSFLTPLEWHFAGHAHAGIVRTPHPMKVGDQTLIWVEPAGDNTEPPPAADEAATEAVVAGFGLWVAVVGFGVAAWALLRRRLDRTRYADWDRELDDLADNGGRTNRNA